MKKQTLHDIAKFFAGLVLGDFLGLWWIGSHGMFPIDMLGITWTATVFWPGLIFDAALFIMLVHYGWHIGKIPVLRERTYLKIAGTIFGIVALAHLVRLFSSTGFVLLGWDVPLWLSWVAVVVAGCLSYMSFSLVRKIGK